EEADSRVADDTKPEAQEDFMHSSQDMAEALDTLRTAIAQCSDPEKIPAVKEAAKALNQLTNFGTPLGIDELSGPLMMRAKTCEDAKSVAAKLPSGADLTAALLKQYTQESDGYKKQIEATRRVLAAIQARDKLIQKALSEQQAKGETFAQRDLWLLVSI